MIDLAGSESSLTYVRTYWLRAYLLTCLLTYLPTYELTYLLTNLLTCLPTYFRHRLYAVIDLAGSESFSFTEDSPIRGINAGLVALGRVLMAMADKATHVPYRDSVVTQLLSGVLGGERPCLMEMLCCLSPNAKHWHESRCTLDYARRCAQLELYGDAEDEAQDDMEV